MWKKKCTNNKVSDVMEELSGFPAEDLLHPKSSDPSEIGSLIEAGYIITKAIIENKKIGIVGDYDADGVTSTAILYMMFSHFGLAPVVRLPRRFSEGYGLSANIVEEIAPSIQDGLLITVDNGISANDSILRAKELGLTVVVLDHHIQTTSIPQADCIVDQHIDELALNGCDKIGFRDYCGAGLAYKLAEYIIGRKSDENRLLMEKIESIAAIGTIADVVPLIGDNRVIVNEGLSFIQNGYTTIGLKALLNECNFGKTILSTDIAYKLVPVINASGRLIDNGARRPCALLATDSGNIVSVAKVLSKINDTRKLLVKESIERIEKDLLPQTSGVIAVFDEESNEGIVGIIAGKLTEKYQLPAIVLTKTEEGIWKGSARSIPDVNILERLDTINSVFLSYGGHKGAAGLSIKDSDKDVFKDMVQKAFNDVQAKDTTTVFYDIEITPDCVKNVFSELQKYQPFGEGCPEPVIRITGCKLVPFQSGCYGFYMGKDKSHLKLNCDAGFSIVGFSMANEYKAMKEPATVDVIGKLSLNVSKWGTVLQVIAESIKPSFY